MTATNTMTNSTPPRTPPMTGARGNLLSPPFEPLCTRFVGEDVPADDGEVVDEVEESKSVAVV